MSAENIIANSETTKQLADAEIELKRKETDLIERAAALAKRELAFVECQIESKQKNTISPVTVTILGGLLTAIVAIFGSCYQGKVNTDLERSKFESVLILKAIEPKDKFEQKQNLQFLVTAGLIKDVEKKIMNIQLNELPRSSSFSPPVPAPVLEGAWGIALETDISLEAAQNNIWKMARQNGYNNSYVFKTKDGYRPTVVFKTESEAQEQIPKARTINPTVSEPKELSKFCPKLQWNQEQQYFECGQ